MDQGAQKKGEVSMHAFVSGGCLAIKESKTFLDDWFQTNRNPCSVCKMDKSLCSFYKGLRLRAHPK
jgi:hypothetical protein